MAVDPEAADQLIQEFRAVVGLDEVDAVRAAYCACAHNRGWSAARIGRGLGVSRARVGQRIERLQQYVEKFDGRMPTLKQLMDGVTERSPGGEDAFDLPVAMEPDKWEDRRFAQGMMRLVTQ